MWCNWGSNPNLSKRQAGSPCIHKWRWLQAVAVAERSTQPEVSRPETKQTETWCAVLMLVDVEIMFVHFWCLSIEVVFKLSWSFTLVRFVLYSYRGNGIPKAKGLAKLRKALTGWWPLLLSLLGIVLAWHQVELAPGRSLETIWMIWHQLMMLQYLEFWR